MTAHQWRRWILLNKRVCRYSWYRIDDMFGQVNQDEVNIKNFHLWLQDLKTYKRRRRYYSKRSKYRIEMFKKEQDFFVKNITCEWGEFYKHVRDNLTKRRIYENNCNK